MKYHHRGYVSHDPRVLPSAGVGLHRTAEIPEQVDVLIVGAGPAGMIAAAQLSQFPGVLTRVVDRRASRLEIGLADGMQKRSIETFDAFGFAEQLMQEACHVSETVFWKPDPAQPENIVRVSRLDEDPQRISEYPHLTVNHARVLDYFAEFMARAPTRMAPDYGWEFVGLEVDGSGSHPITVRLRPGDGVGPVREVRARYVVGADGAHSGVRKALGLIPHGDTSNHAWGVMDILADTDFPDVRTKCAIQSEHHGNILLIPREGGFLFRLYVDLGDVAPDDHGAIRRTPPEEVIRRAQAIFHPYAMDVRHVAWHSIYEVSHRLCDRFDDVPDGERGARLPRVFLAGDACHTHSAKAGQGTNASMQDGFNLGWKLGHVLEGRAPETLLSTYNQERHAIGQDLIDADRTWAREMARPAETFSDPQELERAYRRITEFAQGFMTRYGPSLITSGAARQDLATGYPVGKRFWSAEVVRVCDASRRHLGHDHKADGRWRIYAFADAARAGEDSPVAALARWLETDASSPLRGFTPAGADPDAWFEIKVIYQQTCVDVPLCAVPSAFRPRVGPYRVVDNENVYAAIPDADIFDARGISRGGAVVVVRPDQYVSHVLPLGATEELGRFLGGFAVRRGQGPRGSADHRGRNTGGSGHARRG